MLRRAVSTDLRSIVALLSTFDLPTKGVAEQLNGFVVHEAAGVVVGTGGFELHGSCALLRSLAVSPEQQGRGIATAICDHLEAEAMGRGVDAIYVLTETAERLFAARGYSIIDRTEAPAEIAASEEFAILCSHSATLLRLRVTDSL